jgi:plastocyanin
MHIDFHHIPGWAFLALVVTVILIAVGCTGSGKPVVRNATQNPSPVQQPPGAQPPTAAPPMAMVVTVNMTSNAFAPREIRAMPGDTITWTNSDQVPHTVTVDPGNPVAGGPDSDTDQPDGINPGQSWTWKVPENATAGTTLYYHCRFHGQPVDGKTMGTGMAGAIVVVAVG